VSEKKTKKKIGSRNSAKRLYEGKNTAGAIQLLPNADYRQKEETEKSLLEGHEKWQAVEDGKPLHAEGRERMRAGGFNVEGAPPGKEARKKKIPWRNWEQWMKVSGRKG